MKIIVRFNGGLGNQMSQYAMVTLLKHLYTDSEILCDLSSFKYEKAHNGYELEQVFKNVSPPKISIFDKMFLKSNLYKKIEQEYCSGYPEDKSIYNLNERFNYYLLGTWHNYNYSCIRSELLNAFRFTEIKNNQLHKELSSCNAVSIHVRKGDYKALGLDIVNENWYKNAMQIIKLKIDNPVFYVFSDENVSYMFDSCTDNIKYIVGNTGKNSWIDMWLMKNCKHNIIANSTFSYWAAWLNENNDKLVIRPKMHTADRKTWKVDGWIEL